MSDDQPGTRSRAERGKDRLREPLNALRARLAAIDQGGAARRIPALVSALLAGAVVADVLGFAHAVIGASSVIRMAPAVHADRPSAPRLRRPALARSLSARLVGAHLFGTGSEPARIVAADQGSLKLTGTLAFGKADGGFAILADASANHLYPAGAALPDGATLDRVYADRIVLERAGAEEVLLMPRTSAAASANAPADSVAAAPTAPPADATDSGVASPLRRWFVGLRARQEHDDSGQFIGFRLLPLPRYQRAYGVASGDVLTAINGVPLQSPEQLDRALEGTSGSAISVTVARNGVPQELSIQLR